MLTNEIEDRIAVIIADTDRILMEEEPKQDDRSDKAKKKSRGKKQEG